MSIDPVPLFPQILFDFVAEHIHRAKSRGPTSGRPATSPDDLPLVEEDGLVFRIAPAPHAAGTRPAAGQIACDPEAMASAFRKAGIVSSTVCDISTNSISWQRQISRYSTPMRCRLTSTLSTTRRAEKSKWARS